MSAPARKSGVCLGLGWAMKTPHSALPNAASRAELRKWLQTITTRSLRCEDGIVTSEQRRTEQRVTHRSNARPLRAALAPWITLNPQPVHLRMADRCSGEPNHLFLIHSIFRIGLAAIFTSVDFGRTRPIAVAFRKVSVRRICIRLS